MTKSILGSYFDENVSMRLHFYMLLKLERQYFGKACFFFLFGHSEHLQSFQNPLPILIFLQGSKNVIQQLPILTPNLLELRKINPTTRKYTCVYRSANLEVEGRGEEQGEGQSFQCKCTREKGSIKVVGVI